MAAKGGLSFGIGKAFVPNRNGTGVIHVTIAPNDTSQTTQGEYLAKRQSHKLKYLTPSLDSLTLAKLKPSMVLKLDEVIDRSRLNPDELLYWNDLVVEARYNNKTNLDDDEISSDNNEQLGLDCAEISSDEDVEPIRVYATSLGSDTESD